MHHLKLNRRAFAAVTACCAASVATPTLWAQPSPQKTHVVIAVGNKAAFSHLPLTIAQQLGYFRDEGLEVDISDFAGGAQAMQAVVAGSADVVSGAYEHIINLHSRGQRFEAFVLQGRAPAIAMGISSKTMPHFKALTELKGKKIGIAEMGSLTHVVAKLILLRAGLNAADVNFIGMGTPASALTAWRTGQLDALSNVDPVISMLEQKGEIRIIADTRTLKGTLDLFGGPMLAGCLSAPVEFIQKNPKTVQALTNAVVHGLKWLQTAGPSDIIKTVPEAYLLGDRALYLATFAKVREAISPDGMIADEGPRSVARVLASFDPAINASKIELAKTYTNEFARKAKERFKA